jgi:hypothetical protein
MGDRLRRGNFVMGIHAFRHLSGSPDKCLKAWFCGTESVYLFQDGYAYSTRTVYGIRDSGPVRRPCRIVFNQIRCICDPGLSTPVHVDSEDIVTRHIIVRLATVAKIGQLPTILRPVPHIAMTQID